MGIASHPQQTAKPGREGDKPGKMRWNQVPESLILKTNSVP